MRRYSRQTNPPILFLRLSYPWTSTNLTSQRIRYLLRKMTLGIWVILMALWPFHPVASLATACLEVTMIQLLHRPPPMASPSLSKSRIRPSNPPPYSGSSSAEPFISEVTSTHQQLQGCLGRLHCTRPAASWDCQSLFWSFFRIATSAHFYTDILLTERIRWIWQSPQHLIAISRSEQAWQGCHSTLVLKNCRNWKTVKESERVGML